MAKTRKQAKTKKTKHVKRMRGGNGKRTVTPIHGVSKPFLQIQTPKYVSSFQNNYSSPIEHLYTEKNKSQQVNVEVFNPNKQTSTLQKPVVVSPKVPYYPVKTRKNRKA